MPWWGRGPAEKGRGLRRADCCPAQHTHHRPSGLPRRDRIFSGSEARPGALPVDERSGMGRGHRGGRGTGQQGEITGSLWCQLHMMGPECSVRILGRRLSSSRKNAGIDWSCLPWASLDPRHACHVPASPARRRLLLDLPESAGLATLRGPLCVTGRPFLPGRWPGRASPGWRLLR